VDFELSDEEAALAESVRSICAARYGIDRLKQAASLGERELDASAWESLSEAGVFSLQVPEAAGGVGLGMAPSAVVFEELGRALVPGPLVASHLAARDLGGSLGDGEPGKLVVGSLRLVSPRPSVFAPALVPHLASLDLLVVVQEDCLSVVAPSEVDATAVSRSLDPLTPLWRVDDLELRERAGGAAEAARFRWDETLLWAAFMVGLASRCVEMAVDYAKEREQFGKAIGSFQAVKHICADMLVRAELARVAVHAAALTVDQPGVGDPERAAAGAAMLAADAAVRNAKSCIQVHGGMGFTWEVPAHLFLMRARLLSQLFVPAASLAEDLAGRY
jgi:alkylation response protein AidB-like acyl-CoA dehydrogenase